MAFESVRSTDRARKFLDELARGLYETNEVRLIFGENDKATAKQFEIEIKYDYFQETLHNEPSYCVKQLNNALRKDDLFLFLEIPFNAAHCTHVAEYKGLKIAMEYAISRDSFIIKCLAGTRYV